MIEKFSDYEGAKYLDTEGEFVFEVTDYELKDSKNGTPMAVFTVSSDAGQSTIYHSLSPKARWSYNGFIKACLKLDTKEKIQAFECDYETIGRSLIGKKFIATVKADVYDKIVKVPLEDGTFDETTEERTSYKIDTTSYKWL